MEAERALVTGGTGFLGPQLERELMDDGFDVTAVGRSSGDVTDPQAMRRLVVEARPTHVFHLAGIRDGELDELLRVNVWGTVNVLEAVAAEAPAARVLVAGSAAEYGETTREPVDEDHPLRPVTDYGVAKAAQELAAAAVAARRGLHLTRCASSTCSGRASRPPSSRRRSRAGSPRSRPAPHVPRCGPET